LILSSVRFQIQASKGSLEIEKGEAITERFAGFLPGALIEAFGRPFARVQLSSSAARRADPALQAWFLLHLAVVEWLPQHELSSMPALFIAYACLLSVVRISPQAGLHHLHVGRADMWQVLSRRLHSCIGRSVEDIDEGGPASWSS
ncbi:unnamed protein product, partial [Polarella glacialis]